MDYIHYGQLLDTASLAGKIMLENGAEIYRVEQTVKYVCKAFDAPQCEVFATPTTIIISITDNNGMPYSMVRRITSRGVHLGRVEQINSCSRGLGEADIDLSGLKKELIKIGQLPLYSLPVMTTASAMGAASFVLFLGGGTSAAVGGFILGAFLRLLLSLLEKLQLGSFMQHIIGGAFSAASVAVFHILGIADDWRLLTISVLMLMVPGMLFTNALRDLAAGDLIAGVSRATEAFCVAAALAGGAAIVYFMLQLLGGITLW